jgi:hypothetical protein
MALRSVFYQIKPLMPRLLQIYIRRKIILRKLSMCNDYWPIDENAGFEPLEWQKWPLGKKFALVLTHDVEKEIGQDRCNQLAEVEQRLGFCSSFNFVPERYNVSSALRKLLVKRGFEVGVHDFNHDGKLFSSRKMFKNRRDLINKYLQEWESVGFRAASMHHNLNWIGELNIEYDCSTFDTDPFEPQSDGVGTIFPFWVNVKNGDRGFVELPYTLPQDFTLFILMKHENIDIWKKKLEWIAKKGGMALINVHPDYINFENSPNGTEEYPIDYYKEFLLHVRNKYTNQYWNILPKELSRFIKCNRFQDSYESII